MIKESNLDIRTVKKKLNLELAGKTYTHTSISGEKIVYEIIKISCFQVYTRAVILLVYSKNKGEEEVFNHTFTMDHPLFLKFQTEDIHIKPLTVADEIVPAIEEFLIVEQGIGQHLLEKI